MSLKPWLLPGHFRILMPREADKERITMLANVIDPDRHDVTACVTLWGRENIGTHVIHWGIS